MPPKAKAKAKQPAIPPAATASFAQYLTQLAKDSPGTEIESVDTDLEEAHGASSQVLMDVGVTGVIKHGFLDNLDLASQERCFYESDPETDRRRIYLGDIEAAGVAAATPVEIPGSEIAVSSRATPRRSQRHRGRK